jgi:hypothetical protein
VKARSLAVNPGVTFGVTDVRASEHTAFEVGSYVMKGMNVKSVYGLWNPAWPKEGAESLREAGVNSATSWDMQFTFPYGNPQQ